jgi:hypothetical protein
MKTKTLKVKYYHDPGHGWLAVKRSLLIESGLEKQISNFSYQKGQTVYLEEDSDAYKFVRTMEEKGYTFEVEHRHSERNSPIRNYACYFTV